MWGKSNAVLHYFTEFVLGHVDMEWFYRIYIRYTRKKIPYSIMAVESEWLFWVLIREIRKFTVKLRRVGRQLHAVLDTSLRCVRGSVRRIRKQGRILGTGILAWHFWELPLHCRWKHGIVQEDGVKDAHQHTPVKICDIKKPHQMTASPRHVPWQTSFSQFPMSR